MHGQHMQDRHSTGRRGRSRLRVRLAARLETLSATTTVVLHDISLTGAKISAPAPLRTGQDCVLSWDGHEAFGCVVWGRSGFCGIAFDRPIAPQVLIDTRDRNDAERLPDDFELRRQAARNFSTGVSRF